MRKRVVALDGDVPLDEDTQEDIVASLEQEFATRTSQYRVIFAALILLPSPAFVLAAHARQYPVRALSALISLVASAAALYYAQASILKLNTILAVSISIQALVFTHQKFASHDILWALPLLSLITVWVIEKWTDEAAAEIYGLRQRKFKIDRTLPQISRPTGADRASSRAQARRERAARYSFDEIRD